MPALEVYRVYEIWKQPATLPAEFVLRKENQAQGVNALGNDGSAFERAQRRFRKN